MAEETCELTVPHPAWGGGKAPEGERRKRARSRLPALTILFHPDARRVGERAPLGELLNGRVALLSRNEPGFAAPGSPDLRPLGDLHLSRSPLRLAPGSQPGSCAMTHCARDAASSTRMHPWLKSRRARSKSSRSGVSCA